MGPDIDLGSAMTSKILKKAGEVVPRSTICPLTMEQMDNPDLKEQRHNFDEGVIAKLGDPVTDTDLPGKDLTPTYEAYFDDMTEGTPDAPDKELEPTPEAGDNYVKIDIMLPRGVTLSMERVIERKRDANGKPVGRANESPFLDSRHYLVDFEDSEVTELTANIMAEYINHQIIDCLRSP